MLHGLLAHALAEALLSAPGMLGALDLLFNPTGLLHSLGQAWGNLLLGPLAAIEARSPSQVGLLGQTCLDCCLRNPLCLSRNCLMCPGNLPFQPSMGLSCCPVQSSSSALRRLA